jgi:hypothetical protein
MAPKDSYKEEVVACHYQDEVIVAFLWSFALDEASNSVESLIRPLIKSHCVHLEALGVSGLGIWVQLSWWFLLRISYDCSQMSVLDWREARKESQEAAQQHRFYWEREPAEGVSSKRARAHCHVQALGSNRGSWWKSTGKVTWVGTFSCESLRNAIARQLKKVSCGLITHLLNCPWCPPRDKG